MPKLIDNVNAAGATPILYAYSGPLSHTPAQRQVLQDLYTAAGLQAGVPVAPRVAAMKQVLADDPEQDCHNPDRHHTGMLAGYSVLSYSVAATPHAEGVIVLSLGLAKPTPGWGEIRFNAEGVVVGPAVVAAIVFGEMLYLFACVWYQGLTGHSAANLLEATTLGDYVTVPATKARYLAEVTRRVCRDLAPILGDSL